MRPIFNDHATEQEKKPVKSTKSVFLKQRCKNRKKFAKSQKISNKFAIKLTSFKSVKTFRLD